MYPFITVYNPIYRFKVYENECNNTDDLLKFNTPNVT